MSIDDATLMAFADGELTPQRTAEVAAAVAADPALAAKVERFRAVRAKLAGSLDELTPPADVFERATRAGTAWPRAWLPAVAAGVAGLMIGVATMLALQPAAGDLGQTARGDLHAALEQASSGSAVGAVEPLYTVVGANGRPCRAYRTNGARRHEGVACREADGWRVLALVEAPPRPDGYRQASGGEPPIIEAVLDALDVGEPLPKAAEQALIANRWRE